MLLPCRKKSSVVKEAFAFFVKLQQRMQPPMNARRDSYHVFQEVIVPMVQLTSLQRQPHRLIKPRYVTDFSMTSLPSYIPQPAILFSPPFPFLISPVQIRRLLGNICLRISPRAIFALVKIPVTHLRMLVERRKWQLPATLKTLLRIHSMNSLMTYSGLIKREVVVWHIILSHDWSRLRLLCLRG